MREISNKPSPQLVTLILGVGVLAVSSSAILVRIAIASSGQQGFGFSLFLAASRLMFASLLLIPTWRGFQPSQVSRVTYGYAIGAGICLSFHFAAWISSLSYTSIAASTSLVTTNPLWVTLLSWLWFGEKPTRLTGIGITIAILGGVGIALGDADSLSSGANPLLGDILAVIGAWFVSIYFLLGQQAQKQGLRVSHYAGIAYTTAALILLPLPPLVNSPYTGYPATVYASILGMAVFPQLIGHTSLNWSVKWISPTLVTLAILFEPVLSSVLGFMVFGEVPGLFVLVGAIILLIGVAIAVMGSRFSNQ